jgi:hypothetical protein
MLMLEGIKAGESTSISRPPDIKIPPSGTENRTGTATWKYQQTGCTAAHIDSMGIQMARWA